MLETVERISIECMRWNHLIHHPYLSFYRTSGGRLHLLPDVGKIVLADATLVEDPSDSEREDDGRRSINFRTKSSKTNTVFVSFTQMPIPYRPERKAVTLALTSQ